MLHTNDRFADAIEAAVTRIETTTDAELIVVAAPRSGSYRDVSFLSASIGSLATLLLLLVVPYDVHPWFLPLDLVLSWLFFGWVFSGRWILRWLVPRKRQRRQVSEAAHAEFHREIVHATIGAGSGCRFATLVIVILPFKCGVARGVMCQIGMPRGPEPKTPAQPYAAQLFPLGVRCWRMVARLGLKNRYSWVFFCFANIDRF